MDERPETQEGLSIARVKPVMGGRGLALPPLTPMVGVMCLVLGLAVGFRFAPKAVPAANPAATPGASPAAASIVPSDGPMATAIVYFAPDGLVTVDTPAAAPPAAGLSLTQALDAFDATGWGPREAIVSARVARYWEVLPPSEATMDSWVWAITVRGSFIGQCVVEPWPDASETPSTSADPSAWVGPEWGGCVFGSTQVVVLDYFTGAWLETSEGAPY